MYEILQTLCSQEYCKELENQEILQDQSYEATDANIIETQPTARPGPKQEIGIVSHTAFSHARNHHQKGSPVSSCALSLNFRTTFMSHSCVRKIQRTLEAILVQSPS
eukprot:g1391.t1